MVKFSWVVAVTAFIATMVALVPASAQDGYRLNPGDILRVEVIEDPSLNRDVLISPDGRVSFPLAGNIRAAGRTIEQVRSSLTAALDDDFTTTPSVFVGISALAEREEGPRIVEVPAPEPVTYAVYLLGEVASPGRVEVEPGTTVLQLFALAGGFSDFAATKRIQLRRIVDGVPKIYGLNYEAIEDGRSPNGQVAVFEGDTFIVPTRRLFE